MEIVLFLPRYKKNIDCLIDLDALAEKILYIPIVKIYDLSPIEDILQKHFFSHIYLYFYKQ